VLIAKKVLDPARTLYVYPLTFGRARLSVGNEAFLDDGW
jgi:hypothetical protein